MLICEASRSAEPSGKSGSSFVIRVSRAQSSIRVRRISSVSVSTRIVSSIVFRPRQSRPSGGGPCAGRGGCIACDRNEEEECAALAPIKPRTVRDGRKKGGFGAVRWRKRVLTAKPNCAVVAVLCRDGASGSWASHAFRKAELTREGKRHQTI